MKQNEISEFKRLIKARSKVISAAKRWRKFADDDWPLSKAVDSLNRLENPDKKQNSRRLSDGK